MTFKVLYMFRKDLLSIIRSLNTVYTAIGICHASSVDCLLARSGWYLSSILTSLAEIVHLVGFYYRNICNVSTVSIYGSQIILSAFLPVG